MTNIRIASIVENSVVDGEGTRTVLYMQGCSIACKGCQNFKIWSHAGGHVIETEGLALTLVQMSREHHNYTIQGGEPTEQPEALAELLSWIRNFDPEAHITVYTGRTLEELYENVETGGLAWLLDVDVLVDGQFVASMDDPFILWRGSRNQRPIDVQKFLDTGKIVTLDWELPRLIIGADGKVSMPVGLFTDFKELGQEEKTRRCGDWRK